MVLLIGLCAFLTVALLAVAVAQALSAKQARLRTRLQLVAGESSAGLATVQGGRLLRMQDYSSFPLLQRMLQGTAYAERIADELDRAGITLRVGEFFAISFLGGLFFAIAANLLLPTGLVNILGMIAAFLVGLLIPRWVLTRQMRRRREQIEASLPDALDILARSMRSGTGLLISIDALVDQMPGPLSAEFGRMRQEIAVGVSMEDAFAELDRRVGSKDIHIVVTAVIIQREVGGNLTEILGNVASTMRERVMLRREVQALTAQERWATYIVAAVPPFILVMFSFLQPGFITSLLGHTAGWIVLGIAGVLELSGYLVLRWLVSSFEV